MKMSHFNELIEGKKENVNKLKGYVLQLTNCLRTNNSSTFMDIVTRMYGSLGEGIPCTKAFEKMLTNKEYFRSLGLKVKYGKYLFSEDCYCAGTPKERAKDLNDMFSDKTVKAIFTVKGGDMANGILPYIDFENIKNNPKIV